MMKLLLTIILISIITIQKETNTKPFKGKIEREFIEKDGVKVNIPQILKYKNIPKIYESK